MAAKTAKATKKLTEQQEAILDAAIENAVTEFTKTIKKVALRQKLVGLDQIEKFLKDLRGEAFSAKNITTLQKKLKKFVAGFTGK